MAESAGVINRAGRGADREFQRLVADKPDEVRHLAGSVRELIYDVYPDTVEVIWPGQGSVGWGIGPKKFSEQFAFLMAFKGHVTLGFYYGGQLDDPAGLLRDGGSQVSGTLSMRSLKITPAADPDWSQLRVLVGAAVEHLRAAE